MPVSRNYTLNLYLAEIKSNTFLFFQLRVLLEKLVHLDHQENEVNGEKVALQVSLVPLVCLVNLAHQVFKDLQVKKENVEEKVPKDTED